MNVELLNEAAAYFGGAHDSIGQKRKYTGEPYRVHTEEVAETVLMHLAFCAPQLPVEEAEALVIASYGHDTPEDVFPKNPAYNIVVIGQKYGQRAASIVMQLTETYSSEFYPHLNRATRKLLEASRISVIDDHTKLVKLADLQSNTRSIVEHDPEFAKTYLKEKELLMTHLRNPFTEKLWLDVNEQLGENLKKLGMERTWTAE
jgi:(p)ppGpp synthase/HD superfamily hydrolase